MENVVQHSEEKTAFAMTACHFMEEVNMISKEHESEHNYKDEDNFTSCVSVACLTRGHIC